MSSVPSGLSTGSPSISQWGNNPKTKIPPQGHPRSPAVVGSQQGWPNSYYGQGVMNDTDAASLSAHNSVFNPVRIYAGAGGNQNIQGNYHNGPRIIGAQQQAGDTPTWNTQLVGGSSNGMQTGAGLQVVSGTTGATTPVTGVKSPTPPILTRQ